MAYLGSKVKETESKQIADSLSKWLSENEFVVAFFKVSHWKPITDMVVVTNMRFLSVYMNGIQRGKGFPVEVVADDFEEAILNGTQLFIALKEGGRKKIGIVRKEDGEIILKALNKISGSPTLLNLNEKIKEKNIDDKEAAKREQEQAKEEEQKAKAEQQERVEREKQQRRAKLQEKLQAETPSVYDMAGETREHDARAKRPSRPTRPERSGRCPKCGSSNLQAIQETRTKGVSTVNSTAGCCCLGPVGLLCGLPGAGQSSTKTMRICLNCGKKF